MPNQPAISPIDHITMRLEDAEKHNAAAVMLSTRLVRKFVDERGKLLNELKDARISPQDAG